MYTLSCLAKIRSNGRSLSHHCSSGIRCSVSVFDLRLSTDVNVFCRLIKPNTTALSAVLQTTLPSFVAAFSINVTAYVTALQPNFVANARSNGVGNHLVAYDQEHYFVH